MAGTSERLVVCPLDELPAGGRKVVRTERGRKIVVYNVKGELHALGSICPHQGGPVGLQDGLVTGTTRVRVTEDGAFEPEWIQEGEIVRCGWHLWEFDIKTGCALTDPKLRVARYDVAVVDLGAADDAPHATRPTIVVEV